jgi:hypothetical protein
MTARLMGLNGDFHDRSIRPCQLANTYHGGSTCDGAAGLSEMETALFGEVEAQVIRPQFEPTYATQGKQGVELHSRP